MPLRALGGWALQRLSPALYQRLRRLWWRLRGRGALADGPCERFEDYAAALARLNRQASVPTDAGKPALRLDLLLLLDEDQAANALSLAALAAQQDRDWRLQLCGTAAVAATQWPSALGPQPPCQPPQMAALQPLDNEPQADWLVLLGAGDQPDPQALALLRAQLGACADAQLWYCDHRETSIAGSQLCAKTVWDPLRLQQDNYIGSFFAIRRSALRQLALPATAPLSPSGLLQAAAVRLRATQVCHSPLILMQRAAANDSALPAPRSSFNQQTASSARRPQSLSVLVPTRDGGAHLEACVSAVLQAFGDCALAQCELLLIDNGSRDPATLAYLQRLQQTPQLRVLRYDHPFNYAAINNWAARQASGEALLLLNDDVRALSPDWLEHLLNTLCWPGVGAVGARLLYPDRRLQHAGVALGLGGVAGHPGRGLVLDDPRLRRWGAALPRCVSAVTGACLLTRTSLYFELGGLDEDELTVAFNDVDFCLKLRQAGHLVAYQPAATLEHLESVSRGDEDTLAKQRRFAGEIQTMRRRWSALLAQDPYYSPHWSLDDAQLSYRWPPQPQALRPRSA